MIKQRLQSQEVEVADNWLMNLGFDWILNEGYDSNVTLFQ